VWAGIAQGVTTGYGAAETAALAVRYLIVGLIVIFIRGIVTERITAFLWARRAA
jgi:PTS system glucitol/sorbitol-specific IIC component